MKKVLITGGAGFIGSNIAHELLNRGYDVIIVDNLSTGTEKNIEDIKSEIDFVKGDIRDLDLLQKTMKNVNYVLHQAAIPSVPRSINDPLTTHDNNVNGTINVLLSSRDNDVEKVVVASSSSIYGNRETSNVNTIKEKVETMKPMPLSPYATTKLIKESYCKVFAHIYKLPTTCLRYFNVFGPRQNPESEYAAVIPKFITLIMNNKQPIIYGDGSQTRDFTYIDNVIDANIKAMKAENISKGETLNIACGESYSLHDLVNEINKHLNKDVKPKFDPERNGDVKNSLADIKKAKKLIDFHPEINFVDGLRKTIKWYQDKKDE